MSQAAHRRTLTEEVADVLARSPSAEEIAGFRISKAARKRVAALIEHNENGTLTAAESAELDETTVLESSSRSSAPARSGLLLCSHPC